MHRLRTQRKLSHSIIRERHKITHAQQHARPNIRVPLIIVTRSHLIQIQGDNFLARFHHALHQIRRLFKFQSTRDWSSSIRTKLLIQTINIKTDINRCIARASNHGQNKWPRGLSVGASRSLLLRNNREYQLEQAC